MHLMRSAILSLLELQIILHCWQARREKNLYGLFFNLNGYKLQKDNGRLWVMIMMMQIILM